MISELDKQKLRDLDIRQVAERLGIEVKDRGNSHCFNSTGHANGDKNPSLGFYKRNGIDRFKCFSCGIGGDTIALVKAYTGIDNFREACIYLAQIMGENIDTNHKIDNQPRHIEPKAQRLEPLNIHDHKYPKNEMCQKFYDLCETPNDTLKKWWANRGLSEDTLKFEGWKVMPRDIYDKMREYYTDDELLEGGFRKVDSKTGKVVDSFRGGYNIVVPFFNGGIESLVRSRGLLDWNDPKDIVGIRVRNLTAKKGMPKYLPPTGQALMIYRLDQLYEWLCDTTKAPLFITGSETDNAAMVEFLRIEGEPGYVVSLTGEVKSESSKDLRELVAEITSVHKNAPIYLVNDNDEKGEEYAELVMGCLDKAGVNPELLGKFQPHKELDLKDIGDYIQNLTERRTTNKEAEGK